MTTFTKLAHEQLRGFLGALFRPEELVELRFIESWLSQGKKQSRVVRPATWLHPGEVVARYDDLVRLAETARANVYFGVCPRVRHGDATDESIETIRCLWCDIDATGPDEARQRWAAAGVPTPSIVVGSGSGIHAYWLLATDVVTAQERARIVALLPAFYRSFGGDHVQNPSRILRLPGTLNCKDARNGRPTQPCVLCQCDPQLRYPLEVFGPWFASTAGQQQAPKATVVAARPASTSGDELLSRNADAAMLVFQLGKPASDRSRRDFAVVCELLRLGLTPEEIWPLVAGTSKFETGGRAYFDRTVANAQRRLALDGQRRRQPHARR